VVNTFIYHSLFDNILRQAQNDSECCSEW